MLTSGFAEESGRRGGSRVQLSVRWESGCGRHARWVREVKLCLRTIPAVAFIAPRIQKRKSWRLCGTQAFACASSVRRQRQEFEASLDCR